MPGILKGCLFLFKICFLYFSRSNRWAVIGRRVSLLTGFDLKGGEQVEQIEQGVIEVLMSGLGLWFFTILILGGLAAALINRD